MPGHPFPFTRGCIISGSMKNRRGYILRLKTAVIAVCLLLAFPAVGACSSYTYSVPSSIPNQHIEIVSFTGFMNPGPNVEIVIKNISKGSIFHLVLYLDLGLKTPPGQMVFDFGFTQDKTLTQGATTSLTAIVSNGTFSADTTYVLGISAGVLGQGGATTYNYPISVKSSPSVPITTEAQAIAVASGYVPPGIFTKARLVANNAYIGSRTGSFREWDVQLYDIAVTGDQLGWKLDDKTVLGPDEPYIEIEIKLNAATGELVSRQAEIPQIW